MKLARALAFLALWCAIAASPVWAAETGTISGIVFDQSGAPVAGATVRVSGPKLPAGRSVTTTDNGEFNFPLLLPGAYVVEVTKQGVGDSKRSFLVETDKTTQADTVLGVTVQETVDVVAGSPVIDMKSTEVAFNYSAETIQALPLERSYRGLFQLIPGIPETASTAGNGLAPAAGGSRQENTFLIDGVNLTNPGFGALSTEVNELDVLEFNVKRGAITAEFGRASGFVTNAVTRSGSNDFAGSVRIGLQPQGFSSDSADPNIREKIERFAPAFNIGGPIVKDKLFFYASGLRSRDTTTARSNLLGPVPDSVLNTSEVLGKLTAQPSSRHLINGSYRHRPSNRSFAGIGVRDSPEVATDTEVRAKIANVSWGWFLGDRTVVEVRYLHLTDDGDTIARTDLGFRPTWNPNNLPAMGQFDNGTAIVGAAATRLEEVKNRRSEVKASFSQYLDLGGMSHAVKAGFGYDNSTEDLLRKSNGWGALVFVGTSNSQVRGRYYPDQPAQVSRGTTYSLFVQDDITVAKRLTVNLGLLLNRDEFVQEQPFKADIFTFGFGNEIQPRVGINYNLRPDAGDKVYVNYGRYYAMDQKSSARSLAPGRLFTNDAIFDRVTGVLISDTPGANTTGKVIDPTIDPTYSDEFLVGYATPLFGHWSFDAFYIYRDANNFIEDLPRVLPASSFWYTNLPGATRTYKSLTFEMSRRLANNWALTTSYAWSRFEGNFDLDYNGSGNVSRQTAVFNTSSILQDGPGVFLEDAGRSGPLSPDRTHVFKLYGSYVPVTNLTLGGYLRVQSGTPWAAKGRDWYDGFNRFLEPAGTRRNDVWPNFDFLTSYRVPLGDRVNLGIEGRVLNVFNIQTALFRDQRQYLDGRIRTFSSPPPADCAACHTALMIQGTTQPNPRFGQATEFAPQRRFVLSFLMSF